MIPYGLSIGNRNYLNGINIVGLRRFKITNKEILELTDVYKYIFKTKQLSENLKKLNGKYKDNILIENVVNFIKKNKKRAICTPILI